MIVVACDGAGVVVLDLAAVTIDVPDAWSAAIFLGCAFDLEAGGGDTPDEIRAQDGGGREL
jgi:hypothetical protein